MIRTRKMKHSAPLTMMALFVWSIWRRRAAYDCPSLAIIPHALT
jgi:hypothetical protein